MANWTDGQGQPDPDPVGNFFKGATTAAFATTVLITVIFIITALVVHGL